MRGDPGRTDGGRIRAIPSGPVAGPSPPDVGRIRA
ncbi:hypothetical protein ElP_37420 [Tautonia plasticadhaerens]|uniref:Uncharacterized protein n=1 Tax=Tautonia plasticadhaerens TaxID=2527974 RepID=A0A518H4S4_9BACT|nr:hypothetical protein ElP_37420 [Tautonia plasticadhaerens]